VPPLGARDGQLKTRRPSGRGDRTAAMGAERSARRRRDRPTHAVRGAAGDPAGPHVTSPPTLPRGSHRWHARGSSPGSGSPGSSSRSAAPTSDRPRPRPEGASRGMSRVSSRRVGPSHHAATPDTVAGPRRRRTGFRVPRACRELWPVG
jgi:hypothetical protein